MDETSPPIITIAIGYSISCPGKLPRNMSGSKARPVLEAVIMMGTSAKFVPFRSWRPGTFQVPLHVMGQRQDVSQAVRDSRRHSREIGRSSTGRAF